MAVDKGWMVGHELGAYATFTPAGAELFAGGVPDQASGVALCVTQIGRPRLCEESCWLCACKANKIAGQRVDRKGLKARGPCYRRRALTS
jgi:hypothetical protein